MPHFFVYVDWVILFYFVGLHGTYLLLMVSSMLYLPKFMREQSTIHLAPLLEDLEPPVTIIVPAYNEGSTITSSVRALMQLIYHEYEIIVVNDGSSDETLQVLIDEFSLQPFPEAYRKQLFTQDVRAIYRSTKHANLRVVDKCNGGKADSINAGINASYFPLFCCVDADSILERGSLKKVVRPFIDYPETVASGGVVRILNGCTVDEGFVSKIGLSKNPLVLFQSIEYLRAFMFGRLGWTPINALLIISGAFGVFKKSVVIDAGGYKTGCIGEDMELVVRLHRTLVEKGIPYKIHFVPDPVCWTEAPEDISVLKRQRVRWQIGLAESLMSNLSLLFHRRGKAVSWLAFPFFLIFECFGPLLEVLGFIIIICSFYLGLIPNEFFFIFLLLAVSLGMMVSVASLSIEEVSSRTSNSATELFLLFLVAIVENLGYRQLNSVWRVMGMYNWLVRSDNSWGVMTRKANWTKEDKDDKDDKGE